MRRQFRNMDWNDPNLGEKMKAYQEQRQRNKVFFGIAIAVIGALWIFGNMIHFNFDWSDHWPYIFIVVGILVGIKHSFRNVAWWILILVGVANLVEMYEYDYSGYIWPGVLVIVGIAIALRKKNQHHLHPAFNTDNGVSSENNLNIDVMFGGKKEMVNAKEFKSGYVAVSFGGCELNFMQADIAESPAVLDLKISFSGVEIIVPSHWQIKNEINPSFGSVEDQRYVQTTPGIENKKILILRGTCSFSSVEIKSY